MKIFHDFFRFNLRRILFLIFSYFGIGFGGSIFADSLNPNIQFDGSDNLYSVWLYTSDYSTYVVQGSTTSFSGEWPETPDTISEASTSVQNPVLAVNGNGDSVVLWLDLDSNSSSSVFASIRPSGGSWSTAVEISNGQNTSNDHKVRIDNNGNIVASWTEYTNAEETTRVVYVATATVSGGTWTSPAQVSLQ